MKQWSFVVTVYTYVHQCLKWEFCMPASRTVIKSIRASCEMVNSVYRMNRYDMCQSYSHALPRLSPVN
jgi:hypothetical protein